jgi:hypothetical protein
MSIRVDRLDPPEPDGTCIAQALTPWPAGSRRKAASSPSSPKPFRTPSQPSGSHHLVGTIVADAGSGPSVTLLGSRGQPDGGARGVRYPATAHGAPWSRDPPLRSHRQTRARCTTWPQTCGVARLSLVRCARGREVAGVLAGHRCGGVSSRRPVLRWPLERKGPVSATSRPYSAPSARRSPRSE